MRGIHLILIAVLLILGEALSVGALQAPEVPATPAQTVQGQTEAAEGDEETKVKGLFEQARASAERGENDVAITILQDLVNLFPANQRIPEAYLALGELFALKEKYPQAIEAFRIVLERYGKSDFIGPARFQLALAYIAVKDPVGAVALFEAIPGEEEKKLEIYRKGAEVFLRQGEFVEGIALLQKEIPLVGPPEREEVRGLISRMIRERLKESDLQDLAKRYPRTFPGDEARIQLIELYYGQEEFHQAEREISRFVARFPSHPYVSQGQARLGEIKKRLKAYETLLAAFLPLSGRLSPFGKSALNGIRLALHQYKESAPGASVGLVVKDTEEAKGQLRPLFEETFSDYHPVVLLGPMFSREVEQLAGVIERKGIPMVTPGASAPNLTKGWKFLFRNALTGSSQSRSVAQYAMTTLPQKRFVILYPKEGYGEDLMRAFSMEVLRLGGEVIDAEAYAPNENDFSAPIRRIIDSDLKKYGRREPVEGRKKKEYQYSPGFDAVFVVGEPVKIGLILPQLAFFDIRDVALFGNSGWNSDEMIRLAGRFAEGGIFADGFFVDSPNPAVREFTSAYRRSFQEEPNLFSAQAYDAARMVLTAMKNGANSSGAIRDALVSTKNFPGASGLTSFEQDGEADKTLFLIQVKSGKFLQIN